MCCCDVGTKRVKMLSVIGPERLTAAGGLKPEREAKGGIYRFTGEGVPVPCEWKLCGASTGGALHLSRLTLAVIQFYAAFGCFEPFISTARAPFTSTADDRAEPRRILALTQEGTAEAMDAGFLRSERDGVARPTLNEGRPSASRADSEGTLSVCPERLSWINVPLLLQCHS